MNLPERRKLPFGNNRVMESVPAATDSGSAGFMFRCGVVEPPPALTSRGRTGKFGVSVEEHGFVTRMVRFSLRSIPPGPRKGGRDEFLISKQDSWRRSASENKTGNLTASSFSGPVQRGTVEKNTEVFS